MIGPKDKIGPYTKELFLEFLYKEIGPTFADGLLVQILLSNGFNTYTRAALDKLNQALELVRKAAPPNPFANATDEDIAKELMTRIKKRRDSDQRRTIP